MVEAQVRALVVQFVLSDVESPRAVIPGQLHDRVHATHGVPSVCFYRGQSACCGVSCEMAR